MADPPLAEIPAAAHFLRGQSLKKPSAPTADGFASSGNDPLAQLYRRICWQATKSTRSFARHEDRRGA